MRRFCYLDCLRNSDGCYRWWEEKQVQVGQKGWGKKRPDTRRLVWMSSWNGQFDEIDPVELRKRMEAAAMCDVPVLEVLQDAGPSGEDVYDPRTVEEVFGATTQAV